MSERDLEPTRRSSWSFKAKLGRTLWSTTWAVLGCCSTTRVMLVRLFGGRVGSRCHIGRGVEIAVPWHLRVGDDVMIGDEVVLYSLGEIELESGAQVDVRAHLCAGTHDHRAPGFPLIRSPIHIGADARIGASAFIGPGVRVGERSGVAPQAAVFRDVPPDTRVRGNPARVDEETSANEVSS
ncbi:MAG: hypothetical protein ACO3YY_08125 [Phycisphaerales bacterium]|nr:hypothetical protein [Planctomycetota bacterium]